jgi:predicted nucleic acid-binding OB-fold protein
LLLFEKNAITFVYSFKLIISMKKVTVTMNERELKRFESFKEAEKIVRGIKRGLKEVKQSKEGKIQLKSARQLADEI